MACKYLQYGGLFEKAVCGVTKKELSVFTVDNVCATWLDHTECADYKRATGGCFITTAVCSDTPNKPDNCHELEAMRSFRDNWLRKQPNGEAEIDEYYTIAPQIVMAINAQKNAKEIYKDIHGKYILACVDFTDSGDDVSCYKLYRTMIDHLSQQYVTNEN